MAELTELPFSTPEETSEGCFANNMAMLWADKLKKGVCSWENIPEALRSTVQQLLGGE